MFMATVFTSLPDIAVSSKSEHIAFFTCLSEGGAGSCPFQGRKQTLKKENVRDQDYTGNLHRLCLLLKFTEMSKYLKNHHF